MARRALASIALASAWVAACSSTTKRPAELGDCVPQPDASCPGPNTSGGGGGGAGGDGGGGNPTTDALVSSGGDATVCGASILTSTPDCLQCIASSCCAAGTACANDAECLGILQACAPKDTTCQSLYPAGITDYTNLVNCLQVPCPQCVPQATTVDP